MKEIKIEKEILTILHNNNLSVKEISNKLGISSYAIRKNLKEIGLFKGRPNADSMKLCDNYKITQSLRATAKNFNLSVAVVINRLKPYNIINKPIVYSFNENAFANNTAEIFYWAGFIAADGCVFMDRVKYKKISIQLSNKDMSLLRKLKEFLSFDGPIRIAEKLTPASKVNKKYCSITIRSDKIFNDLARFNIVPQKTLTYSFPEWLIEHPMVNHFMRGYVDGDGGFYNSYGQLIFSVCGTEKFIKSFACILKNKKVNTTVSIKNTGNLYRVRFGGNKKVFKMKEFLYKGSNNSIRLDRKYKIANDDKFIPRPKDFQCKPIHPIQ